MKHVFRPQNEWFAGTMATAETGQLPIFFADYDIDLSGVSAPPPPAAKLKT